MLIVFHICQNISKHRDGGYYFCIIIVYLYLHAFCTWCDLFKKILNNLLQKSSKVGVFVAILFM